MVISQRLKIPSIDYDFPSILEMSDFGQKYKKDWEYLCRDKEFKQLILGNLELADIRAKEILGVK